MFVADHHGEKSKHGGKNKRLAETKPPAFIPDVKENAGDGEKSEDLV